MMKRLLALAMLVGLLGVSEASVPAVTPQAPSPYARAGSVPYDLPASDAVPSSGAAAS